MRYSLKNVIIVGPSRAGKTTLAKRLHEKFNYFVISLDMLVAVFQAAYAKYFTDEAPTRSCVQVAALPKGALFEIEAVAVK